MLLLIPLTSPFLCFPVQMPRNSSRSLWNPHSQTFIFITPPKLLLSKITDDGDIAKSSGPFYVLFLLNLSGALDRIDQSCLHSEVLFLIIFHLTSSMYTLSEVFLLPQRLLLFSLPGTEIPPPLSPPLNTGDFEMQYFYLFSITLNSFAISLILWL